ncbi:MAG TPA: hypothetical protein VI455_08895 [Terriglobia bacterium]
MSKITELPIKAPLKKRLISKSEVEKYLNDNLHSDYTPPELHGEEAALKAFGVVGPDFNLEKFLVSFYTEQAAGFYDPRRQTMFMADWVEPDQQKMVLAHELTHALQDQSFDLWKYMHATRDDDDASAAREALVEGYATLAMLQSILGSMPVEKLPSVDTLLDQVVNQQMAEYPVFSRAPFFLRFQMLFPYIQGLQFALKGLQLGGWTRLNQTFTLPPTSTRQIFQPGLYYASTPGDAVGNVRTPGGRSDPGAPLALPPPPALEGVAGLRRVEANTMGALGYYALLGQLISPEEAPKVSGSWVADRYLVYEGPAPGQFTLLVRTKWANEEAASSFCSDYRTILEKRSPEAVPDDSGSAKAAAGTASAAEVLLQTSGPRRTILLRQGDECRWAEGVPADQADALAKWLASL